MTYLGGSLAGMVADRNLWKGRADQAWGTTRQWSNGASFETDVATMAADRNTWQGRANQAWGSSRQWNLNASFETDLATRTAELATRTSERDTWKVRADNAWGATRGWSNGESFETGLTNMTASRDYWQHTVAHNDANVWTTRYNAGYAAGVPVGDAAGRAAVMPAGSAYTPAYATATGGEPAGLGGGNGNYQIVSLQGIANNVLTFWTTAQTITAPATGNYAIGIKFRVISGGGDALRASLRLLKNGSPSIAGLVYGSTESNATHDAGQISGWHCLVQATAGDTFQIQGYHSWGMNDVTFMCVFVPTPNWPH